MLARTASRENTPLRSNLHPALPVSLGDTRPKRPQLHARFAKLDNHRRQSLPVAQTARRAHSPVRRPPLTARTALPGVSPTLRLRLNVIHARRASTLGRHLPGVLTAKKGRSPMPWNQLHAQNVAWENIATQMLRKMNLPAKIVTQANIPALRALRCVRSANLASSRPRSELANAKVAELEGTQMPKGQPSARLAVQDLPPLPTLQGAKHAEPISMQALEKVLNALLVLLGSTLQTKQSPTPRRHATKQTAA